MDRVSSWPPLGKRQRHNPDPAGRIPSRSDFTNRPDTSKTLTVTGPPAFPDAKAAQLMFTVPLL
jgi:hypothetical protein